MRYGKAKVVPIRRRENTWLTTVKRRYLHKDKQKKACVKFLCQKVLTYFLLKNQNYPIEGSSGFSV
jgi:hypothetical protein